ncbi:MAG: type II toxin-antitoxin system VapC family toxin [Bifidobacteriaceae bacterium]|jgi:predicted nucleic acid-binding protein|nr:type II toxin-antitoxin system VapC family toxin [Bifidobacteriaceae bacterium]
MIIADTNVVSEMMREAPAPNVLAWAQGLGPAELTVCVVTVEEIERGLGRLPEGRRRDGLTSRWRAIVDQVGQRIASYDLSAARATAELLARCESIGRTLSLADAQIAGICLAGGHRLATRNVRDFQPIAGLSLTDPFA